MKKINANHSRNLMPREHRDMSGENNPMWKGDSVGINSLHRWVEKRKPKPDVCEECKTNPPIDLANISQKYLRDINDFKWVCRSCHMWEDKRIKNLKSSDKFKKLINKSCCICGEKCSGKMKVEARKGKEYVFCTFHFNRYEFSSYKEIREKIREAKLLL